MADNMVTANYPSGVQTFDPNSPARENLVWNPVTGQIETASGAPVSGAGVLTTWAALPAAETMTGRTALVTDVGLRGSLWYSDGSVWGLVSGQCVLGQSAVAKTVTAGSTAEEVLEQLAVPAGLMGVNGALRLTTIWTSTANANVKTLRARLGATALGGSAWYVPAWTGTASRNDLPQVLRNRGVANSQITYAAANGGSTTSTGTAFSTFTEDTSTALVFALTGQKATGSDTLILEGWTLELLRP